MLQKAVGTALAISGLGASGAVVAAIDHDSAIAWTGAAVAIAGFVLNAVINQYHKLREATRDEDAKDRERLIEDIRDLVRLQAEMSQRIDFDSKRLDEIDSHIQRIRCRYPNADGTARCTGTEEPPIGAPA